jgi:hypothetical protein
MKTTDFITENFVEDAAAAHQDHEVQMARSDCYNAAKYAIELHKLLKNISEQEGLEGWVSEKITLANDYLRTVTEYLRYEQQSSSSGMPEFNIGTATQTLDAALGESTIQESNFVWRLRSGGEFITPYTTNEPYTFKSKEEAIEFAKRRYKLGWEKIVTPTPYDVADSLAGQKDKGWDGDALQPVQEDDYDDAVAAFLAKNKPTQGKTHKPRAAERLGGSKHIGTIGGKGTSKGRVSGLGANTHTNTKPVVTAEDDEPQPKRKPAVVKTNKEIGTRVADIGPGGKEYNVKTNKAWDDQHKEVDEERTVTRDETGKIISWRDESDWRKVEKDKDGRGKVTNLSDKARRETEQLKKQQGVDEGKADPVGSWVVYDGGKVKRFKSREGAKAYAAKNGGKVASSEHYADNIQKQSVSETTSSGSVATSMGGGNGFANGGPGTIARPQMKKKK